MDCKKIGEYIQLKRKEAGLTQAQLGEILGVTSKAVSKWETGVAIPDISLFAELTKILNITIEELLQGEDNKKETFTKKIDIKIILYIIIGLLFILSCSLLIYFKSNYSKVDIYKIKSTNNDFHVDGSLMVIDDKSYLSITNVEYVGAELDLSQLISEFKYEIYLDEKNVFESNRILLNELTVLDILSMINFSSVIDCSYSTNDKMYFSFRLLFDDVYQDVDILLNLS